MAEAAPGNDLFPGGTIKRFSVDKRFKTIVARGIAFRRKQLVAQDSGLQRQGCSEGNKIRHRSIPLNSAEDLVFLNVSFESAYGFEHFRQHFVSQVMGLQSQLQ